MVKKTFFLIIAALSIFLLTGSIGYFYFSHDLPSLEKLKEYRPTIVTEVYSSDYVLIGKFYNEERYVIELDEIPKHVIDCILSAEDSDFFSHKGFNFKSILRATLKNFFASSIRQGGSTITQQVAKTFLLTREKTIKRKIKELILSFKIEENFSKSYILYLYLNQIYFGYGSYGIQAASRNFFNKNVWELNIAEAAMLAGLPSAPSKYSPHLHFDRAKNRQEYVIKRLLEDKKITPKEAKEAINHKIQLYPKKNLNDYMAPYFVEEIRKYFVETYGNSELLNNGYKIFTTLDFRGQKLAEKALRHGLLSLDKREGYRGPISVLKSGKEIQNYFKEKKARVLSPIDLENNFEIAVVLEVNDRENIARVKTRNKEGVIKFSDMSWARPFNTMKHNNWDPIKKISVALKRGYVIYVSEAREDKGITYFKLQQRSIVQGALYSRSPQTGFVKAMVGGFDFTESKFNRAVQARRQLGSAFKPIVYCAALDKGYTPATIIVDAPIIYDEITKDSTWKPDNFGNEFHGDITFRQALVHSYNIPTIKIASDITLSYLTEFADRLGLSRQYLAKDLSIVLGSSCFTPEEIASTYSIFPNQGKMIAPVYITRILNRDDDVIEQNSYLEQETSMYDQVAMLETYFNGSDKNHYLPEYNNKKLKNIIYNEIDKTDTFATDTIESPVLRKTQKRTPFGTLLTDIENSLSPQTSFLTTHLLRGVVQGGTGYQISRLQRPVAGKTGTTNNYNDAWFVGYTPNLATSVWVGFDEEKSIGRNETGAEAAIPIWLEFMENYLKNEKKIDFDVPENIIFARIDRDSGLLATPETQKVVYEAFLKGTEPTEYSKNKETSTTGDILFDDDTL